jgi:hypothetical protein
MCTQPIPIHPRENCDSGRLMTTANSNYNGSYNTERQGISYWKNANFSITQVTLP